MRSTGSDPVRGHRRPHPSAAGSSTNTYERSIHSSSDRTNIPSATKTAVDSEAQDFLQGKLREAKAAKQQDARNRNLNRLYDDDRGTQSSPIGQKRNGGGLDSDACSTIDERYERSGMQRDLGAKAYKDVRHPLLQAS